MRRAECSSRRSSRSHTFDQAAGRLVAPATIGKGSAWPSFQEVMGLDVGSDPVAVAIWKKAKTGT
jgi:hypothetical protein